MSHARLYIANQIDETTVPSKILKPGVDIEHFILDSFGIDDARRLKDRAQLLPTVRKRRDFLISFQTITSEAQNALLKLFEEPPSATVFHLIVPKESLLLQTLRSRLQLMDGAKIQVDLEIFKNFLDQEPGERMDDIAKHVKAKDTDWIESLLSGAEVYAYEEIGQSKQNQLTSLLFIRKYYGSRGSSAKMLLEELALTLP